MEDICSTFEIKLIVKILQLAYLPSKSWWIRKSSLVKKGLPHLLQIYSFIESLEIGSFSFKLDNFYLVEIGLTLSLSGFFVLWAEFFAGILVSIICFICEISFNSNESDSV